MNLIQDKDRSKAGRFGIAMAGALFLSLLSFSVLGSTSLANQGQGGNQGGDDPPGGGFAHDDEAVGTLPTRGKEAGPLDPPTAPGFYIQGPRTEVMQSFLGAYGDGTAVIEMIEDPSAEPGAEQYIKISFEGVVTAQLDGSFLANSDIQAGIVSPDPIGSTMAAAMTDTTLLMTTVLPAESSAVMPLGAFATAGFLDQGVHVLTSNRQLGRDQIDITAIGGIVEIRQGAPLGL